MIYSFWNGMQTRFNDDNSVCLSVRLPTHALWQNGRKNLSRFLYHTNDY